RRLAHPADGRGRARADDRARRGAQPRRRRPALNLALWRPARPGAPAALEHYPVKSNHPLSVLAGLGPAIHEKPLVGPRAKPGEDDWGVRTSMDWLSGEPRRA